MQTYIQAFIFLAFSAFAEASDQKSAEMAQFTPPVEASAGTVTFSGRLTLNTDATLRLDVIRDDYRFADKPRFKMDQLPAFSFAYVQDGKHLIPVRRGAIPGNHPKREYILEPGRIWQDPTDRDTSHVSLPFTLQERNANCMHNGVMRFSIESDGAMSPVTVLIASETCLYFKFNLRGTLTGTYQATDIPHADAIRVAFHRQQEARLETQTMANLAQRFPAIEVDHFAGRDSLPAEDISQYGFVLDGIHYRSDCITRSGQYPFCEQLSLPSYSLAKSLFAGLAAMRLEKLYPGSIGADIARYVPECRNNGNWDSVTMADALNMVTGNFSSTVEHHDEDSPGTEAEYFSKSRHSERILFACNAWPKKAPAGTQWVYHSTDTYVLGTAMNALLREHQGPDADIFDHLVLPLWQDMALSPALAVPRRTDGPTAQTFTDSGLTLLADDIARLAIALNQDRFVTQLDRKLYNSALQRLPSPQGQTYPGNSNIYYSNGFWAYNAQSLLECDKPVIIPFMSGFGGISVVMMPNDTVYYIFTDSGKFAFTDMLIQSHRIRSMCAK